MTIRLHCLADARRSIKHRAPVRFHIGTAEIMGLISLLDCDAIEPGGWGLAQIFLREPTTATWGQPFVVRGSSATHTLGGGQVLQPVARKIRRRHVEMLERIEKLWSGNVEERVLTVAWFSGFSGFTASDLVRDAKCDAEQARDLIEKLKVRGDLIDVSVSAARRLLLHKDMMAELDQRIFHTLGRLHEQFPLMSAHDRQSVQSQLDYVGDDALVNAAVDRLIQQRRIVGDLRRIARADHKPKLTAPLRKLKEKVVTDYREARCSPPDPASFAPLAGGNAAALKDLFEVCIAESELVHISGDIYLHSDVEAEMRRLVQQKLAAGNGLTVAEIRDLLGTSRKFAVPLCEYLDRVGVTRREGDLRVRGNATPQTAKS